MKVKATFDMKNNQCCKDLVFIFQLENFINENNGTLGSATEAGRNAVEVARANLEWTKNHKNEILDWLQNWSGESNGTDGSGSTGTDGIQSTQTNGSGNIATNTIVITVTFIIALLHTTQIFNCIM